MSSTDIVSPASPPPSGPASDGNFQMDLTSMNLSAADIATITAAFNQAITSCPPVPPSDDPPSSSDDPPSEPSTPRPDSPQPSNLKMKKSPPNRRKRAMTSIVASVDVIQPENIPGSFLHFSQEDLNKLVYDNDTALAFAAKVGLIENIRPCHKCRRNMVLCRFKNSCGYRVSFFYFVNVRESSSLL